MEGLGSCVAWREVHVDKLAQKAKISESKIIVLGGAFTKLTVKIVHKDSGGEHHLFSGIGFGSGGWGGWGVRLHGVLG